MAQHSSADVHFGSDRRASDEGMTQSSSAGLNVTRTDLPQVQPFQFGQNFPGVPVFNPFEPLANN